MTAIIHYYFSLLELWLKKPITLPAGTLLELQATFDNSLSNRAGLDSSQWVKNGPDLAKEEMLTIELFGVSSK